MAVMHTLLHLYESQQQEEVSETIPVTESTMSDINWEYKVDITDDSIFSKMEKKYHITFDSELKELISMGNGAVPTKKGNSYGYRFKAGTSEHVFGSMLDFNFDSKEDSDYAYMAIDAIRSNTNRYNHLIPFGIDPFGNYICYDTKMKKVVFWSHETDVVTSTDKNLNDFFQSLY